MMKPRFIPFTKAAMEKKVYELTIREMKEGKDTYFLGTIADLEGFLVEGDTVEEVKEIAAPLLVNFLEVLEKLKQAETFRRNMSINLQAA